MCVTKPYIVPLATPAPLRAASNVISARLSRLAGCTCFHPAKLCVMKPYIVLLATPLRGASNVISARINSWLGAPASFLLNWFGRTWGLIL